MDIRKLSDRVSVSPQVTTDDIATIAAEGFGTIICNRPDGEAADQPTYAEIEAGARAAGLEARYVPVTAGTMRDADVSAFGDALADLPGPVLAYCRTGTRSATLWSLHEAGKRPLAKILATTRAAGYDLSGMAQRIAERGQARLEQVGDHPSA